MATAISSNETMTCLEQIGEAAGQVWHTLSESGPISITKLAKAVDAPRDVVMQAIGWLAREGKIEIDEQGRSRTVCLRDGAF